MEDYIIEDVDAVPEENSPTGDMHDVESIMEVLTRVDLDLSYSSEKLVNLQVLLMHLLAWDNDLDGTAIVNIDAAATSVEKALVFDLLSGILDAEVSEVENFMENIKMELVDVSQKVFSCRNLTEVFTKMEEKLHGSEESWSRSQEQVLEVRAQSAKLQKAFSAFRLDNWQDDKARSQILNVSSNSKRQTAEQQRHILRMLESSLARELDLEKKLSELKQNEEQLKLKLHYTEQVAFRMEEAAEVTWGRFLEAENAAEVLMGISKELAGRLQIFQFNLNGYFQREAALNSKLEDCLQQLDAKDTAIKNLEKSIAEQIAKSSEVPALMERVKSLEEQLKKSELHLMDANALNEESQEQLSEMENIVESLKESAYEAENRSEASEAKVAQLTDTNVELTEEINFLKISADDNTKKVTVLEKQTRDLEIQLQHAKLSSEASQEQQNMLYSAIWDMETLIDDLKSKVSKAESKTENVEEQLITVSETNMELNKEISFLRSRMKTLETSLEQVNNSKAASAKEINRRTGLIMDTVMQLARERERIQNQLLSSSKENQVLLEKLRNANGGGPLISRHNTSGHEKKLLRSEKSSSSDTRGKSSEEAMSSIKSLQEDNVFEHTLPKKNEEGTNPDSLDDDTDTGSKHDATRLEQQAGKFKLSYTAKAIMVAVLAVVVIYLLHKKPVLFHQT